MGRRIALTLAVVVIAVAAVPQLVQAAAGVFTSGAAGTPAVKATNTAANGKGVEGASSATTGTSYGVYGSSKSNAGIGVYGQNTSTTGTGFAWGLKGQTSAPNGRALEGYASSTGSSKHTGVVGVANGGGTDTSGVFGWAKGTSTETRGVFGQSDSGSGVGVLGVATHGPFGDGVVGFGAYVGTYGGGGSVGVYGDAGAIGDGTYGVYSAVDQGISGHLIAGSTNLAGTCSIGAGLSVSPTCLFNDPFPQANGLPVVVVTAFGDPGGYLYVSGFTTNGSGDVNGFTVTRSGPPGAAVVVMFHVIGIDTNLAPSSAARAAQRARFARYE